MKTTITSIHPDMKSYIQMIAGLVLVVLGLIVMYDFILPFFRLLLGLLLITLGVYFFNYEKNKYGYRFFRF